MDVIGTLLASGALLAALTGRAPIGWTAAAAGLASIVITVLHPLLGRQGSGWAMAEVLPLLVLIVLAVRRAPGRQAWWAALPVLAVGVILVRLVWAAEPYLMVSASAGWSLPALVAAAVGLYLRRLDETRRAAVREARRAQRLALARDLHDYVAHDLSGILVQAQAAQVVPGPLPPAVSDALRRIEAAGQRAMASMDRTVDVLHDEPHGRSLPGIAALDELVEGFSPPVSLSMTPGLDLSREGSATVYRVVTEALTNVRRHAVHATRVSVSVTSRGDVVRVVIEDDGGGHSEAGDRGGYGLAGLAERVELLGGTLSAGPVAGGWALTAEIPA